MKSMCRQQTKCDSKVKVCYGMSGKKFRKRCKSWLPPFSPFPTMFSKPLFYRVEKSPECMLKSYNSGLYGKELYWFLSYQHKPRPFTAGLDMIENFHSSHSDGEVIGSSFQPMERSSHAGLQNSTLKSTKP